MLISPYKIFVTEWLTDDETGDRSGSQKGVRGRHLRLREPRVCGCETLDRHRPSQRQPADTIRDHRELG